MTTKRTAALVLAALMILALCSCGQKAEAATWQEKYDLGAKYLDEGNYQEAVLAFTAAIEIDPKNPDAYVGRGDAYIELGEYDKAADDYEDAISLDPTLEDTYRVRIEALQNGGEYEDEEGNQYDVYGRQTGEIYYKIGRAHV
jgi:Tfp pilus assembly protein PilF